MTITELLNLKQPYNVNMLSRLLLVENMFEYGVDQSKTTAFGSYITPDGLISCIFCADSNSKDIQEACGLKSIDKIYHSTSLWI